MLEPYVQSWNTAVAVSRLSHRCVLFSRRFQQLVYSLLIALFWQNNTIIFSLTICLNDSFPLRGVSLLLPQTFGSSHQWMCLSRHAATVMGKTCSQERLCCSRCLFSDMVCFHADMRFISRKNSSLILPDDTVKVLSSFCALRLKIICFIFRCFSAKQPRRLCGFTSHHELTYFPVHQDTSRCI